MTTLRPDLAWEQEFHLQGYSRVAGVDEVGRGPLAGPLVVGAVVLPVGFAAAWGSEVRDSKRLSPGARERLAGHIREDALAWGLGCVDSAEIDRRGLGEALRQGVRAALVALGVPADFVLVDGLGLRGLGVLHRGVVRGDAKCLSIAAASIIAKVERDAIMVAMDGRHPGYGFARHKGYGTLEHLECLHRLGPCAIHRRSFAPVRACLQGMSKATESPSMLSVGAEASLTE